MRATGTRRRRSLLSRIGRLALAGGVGWLSLIPSAHALDAAGARTEAARDIQIVRRELTTLAPHLVARPRPPHSAEELIAAGEVALHSKDYAQAIDVLEQVMELHAQGKASPNAHADARFMLAEAYFADGQRLSARRHYQALLALGDRPPCAAYAGRSLARLVDIAVHAREPEALEALEAIVARLGRGDVTGGVDYARGKLELARGRLDLAERHLRAVPEGSEQQHQALYLLGTVLLRRSVGDLRESAGGGLDSGLAAWARFAPALAQFHALTQLPKDTPAHRHVIDEAWLAIGRLSYESERYVEAAQAFIQVGESSPVYPEMLFELAWAYVRLGDYERAERALELLAAVAPDTLDVADGALLRADLMLRSGRFSRALAAYEQVRTRFDAARARVERFLATSRDPALYYDRLIEDGLAIGGAAALPEVVLDWVREQARGERVFNVIDDVTRSREMLQRAGRLGSKLNALLAAPSRARAFPEIESALIKIIVLENQLGAARRKLALGFDDVEPRALSGELGHVRRRRRELMDEVSALPISSADFEARREEGEQRWSELSRRLSRATLETDTLQAVINGLSQLLARPEQHGVTRDAASRARFRAQVEGSERALRSYRSRIETYRREIEDGRVQVGLGDPRYARETAVRRRFGQLLAREVGLLAARQGGRAAFDYARSVAPQLAEIATLERQLERLDAALTVEVKAGSDELRRAVSDETERLAASARELDALDRRARALVGEVAMKSFASVRERLKSIVLRADVGIVQQAWEQREEQQAQLRGLQRERALEEQQLEDELREVSDEAGEGP